MDRRRPSIGPVLATLFVFLSGCASSPKPAATPTTGPAGIPIPADFQKVEKDSVLISIGESQAGLVVYRGELDPTWVVDFYRETLPLDGWTLVASFISDDSILVFTKEHHACVIRVSGSDSSSRLELRIGSAELPSGSPPQSSQPARPRY
jgi:hypothetical protein